MTKTKYTPGPWLIDDGNFISALQDSAWLGHPTKSNRFSLLIQPGKGCSREEIEANALLIHTTPKLLEALKNLRNWCDKNLNESSLEYAQIMDEADIIIAKAEGRQDTK